MLYVLDRSRRAAMIGYFQERDGILGLKYCTGAPLRAAPVDAQVRIEDEARVEGRLVRNTYTRIRSLALDPDRTPACDLFRLKRYRTIIIISERVKAALSSFDDLDISPAEGWADKL